MELIPSLISPIITIILTTCYTFWKSAQVTWRIKKHFIAELEYNLDSLETFNRQGQQDIKNLIIVTHFFDCNKKEIFDSIKIELRSDVTALYETLYTINIHKDLINSIFINCENDLKLLLIDIKTK